MQKDKCEMIFKSLNCYEKISVLLVAALPFSLLAPLSIGGLAGITNIIARLFYYDMQLDVSVFIVFSMLVIFLMILNSINIIEKHPNLFKE